MEPLIIAILIGLITSIFNKVKESPSNKPVRQKPIQTASPPPSEPRERGRERERPARSRVPREYKEPLKDAASSIQSRFEEKKKEAESTYIDLQKKEERYSRRLEAHQTRAKKIRDKSSTLNIDFKNEDDIVKGFIFSEVFGPPRSKKRHHQK
ncbi:hypothetical protein ACQCWA_03380 [Rossellomorea aquimaris]|uniref:hypothetical protein n=1 Tax=Bacillaceae TaxID=186817 RepID=UPI0011ECD272|nr:hypothetical protein [Bacillus sp. CH30_1T]KAA0560546.1 hypothetical protein F0342_22430 [Bacillus sp. CH30_1T]